MKERKKEDRFWSRIKKSSSSDREPFPIGVRFFKGFDVCTNAGPFDEHNFLFLRCLFSIASTVLSAIMGIVFEIVRRATFANVLSEVPGDRRTVRR